MYLVRTNSGSTLYVFFKKRRITLAERVAEMKVKVIQIHKTDRIENIKILYRKSTKSHYYIHGSRS